MERSTMKTKIDMTVGAFEEMPVGLKNRPVYSDGVNRDLFLACARPSGATIGELKRIAHHADVALAYRYEPILKHSRTDGKRGVRWHVFMDIDGETKLMNRAGANSTFSTLSDGVRVFIRKPRPVSSDGVYIDSNGKTPMEAARASMVKATDKPAPETPAPADTPAKPVKRTRKAPSTEAAKTALIESTPEPENGRGILDPVIA